MYTSTFQNQLIPSSSAPWPRCMVSSSQDHRQVYPGVILADKGRRYRELPNCHELYLAADPDPWEGIGERAKQKFNKNPCQTRQALERERKRQRQRECVCVPHRSGLAFFPIAMESSD